MAKAKKRAKRAKKRGRKNPTKYVVSKPRKKPKKRQGARTVRTSDGQLRTLRRRKANPPPRLTAAQSRKRFAKLKKAGCKPRRVRLSDGTSVVVRKKACKVNPKKSGFAELRDVVASILARQKRPARATAHPAPHYWRIPLAARAAKLRRLARGTSREKRAAIAIARAERAHEGGPPKRKNPALDDAGALAEYEDKHWGKRPRGIRRGQAADPKYGTAVDLGELRSVVYRTTKRGDGGEADYEHEFEGERPRLAFNDGGLLVLGGDYTVRRGGITG